MKNQKVLIFIFLVLLFFALGVEGISEKNREGHREATDYVAVAPKYLEAGTKATVNLTLMDRSKQPAVSAIEVSLLKESEAILTSMDKIEGKGSIEIEIPEDIPEGNYTLFIKGEKFEGSTPVTVKNRVLLFLQTDKPIYKPAQTIHI